MTKVLAIAGGARRRGNSDTLLARAVEAMEGQGAKAEWIVASELSISPCRSCGGCWETGVCVVRDQMQDLYPAFCDVDHIAVAAPIYFTSLPGHLKVLIDRFQCFWVRTYRLGKPPQPRRTGMFLCVGAEDKPDYYRGCLTIVRTWMSVLNVKCKVSRFYPGLDAKEDVQRQQDYLDDATSAGRKLLRLTGPLA